ncbi:hypothetical protein [Streptomyces gobiensis]|uniref:hypothetical protein n=1 Tax=Streptomyces gobiensis TaxID=2875706 RepID=UPI001E62C6CC|nr:hypothetical protein [Streptomyces gobiensis]UGY91681.1 hypothetical protein test1122_08050 [Streptomyces gobiensis]
MLEPRPNTAADGLWVSVWFTNNGSDTANYETEIYISGENGFQSMLRVKSGTLEPGAQNNQALTATDSSGFHYPKEPKVEIQRVDRKPS